MPFNPDAWIDTPNPTYYWERVGEADGQQKHPRRVLDDPTYQVDYDRGYNEGIYFANTLDRETI